jgi:hypothetical protein
MSEPIRNKKLDSMTAPLVLIILNLTKNSPVTNYGCGAQDTAE